MSEVTTLDDISIANYMDVLIGETPITDMESWSGFQAEANIVEVRQFNASFARKLVGSNNVSAVEITCSYNPNSASYKALATAEKSKEVQTFTVKYWDSPAKTKGVQRTFKGIVSSVSESGEYDAQRTVSYTIAVDGALGEPSTATKA